MVAISQTKSIVPPDLLWFGDQCSKINIVQW